jgi:acyl-CoA reductase-like NAD-dependent aldehyde dehydrogenase
MFVNCYNDISPGTPFGGYKKSGIGRENHLLALEAYTQVKTIHVSTNPNRVGWYAF